MDANDNTRYQPQRCTAYGMERAMLVTVAIFFGGWVQ